MTVTPQTETIDLIVCDMCGHTLPRGHDFRGNGTDNGKECVLCALIYAERRDEALQVIETFIDAARWHADLDIETPLPSTGAAERMAARDRIAWMLGSTGEGWKGNRDDVTA